MICTRRRTRVVVAGDKIRHVSAVYNIIIFLYTIGDVIRDRIIINNNIYSDVQKQYRSGRRRGEMRDRRARDRRRAEIVLYRKKK